jgi:hypothetical protein
MTGNASGLAAFIWVAALAGCAAQPPVDDPNLVALPHSGLRFAAKDANDRHLIVENGKECERMADSFGGAAHPGRAVAASGVENAIVGGVTYGVGGATAVAGAVLGGISGALAGGAVPVARGEVPGYETIVRNCMHGMGHEPVE